MRRMYVRLLAWLMALVFVLPLPALAQSAPETDGWYHFLLIGTDTRQDVENAGRSDTMIICSLHAADGRIKLASLARDMWVDIPGKGKNKLNAAHSWGGPELLLETINQNFGMNLTDYVSINFFGLTDLVDAMGGVEVEITSAEAGVINSSVAKEHPHTKVTRVKEGQAHLCGVQALAYARIRKLDSDFGRTARQRKLLSAMLTRAGQLEPLQLLAVGAACTRTLTLRIDFSQIAGLLPILRDQGLNGIEELSLPSEGHYRYHSNDGISKVLFDAEQVAQEWHNFIND